VYTYYLNPLTSSGLSGGRFVSSSSGAGSEIAGWECKLVMEYCNEVIWRVI
jgi:hypothetical protein